MADNISAHGAPEAMDDNSSGLVIAALYQQLESGVVPPGEGMVVAGDVEGSVPTDCQQDVGDGREQGVKRRYSTSSSDSDDGYNAALEDLLAAIGAMADVCARQRPKKQLKEVTDKVERIAKEVRRLSGQSCQAPETVDCGTQTESPRRIDIMEVLQSGTVEALKEITDRKWPRAAWATTTVKAGLPGLADSRGKVFMVDTRGDKNGAMVDHLRRVAPGASRWIEGGLLTPGSAIRDVAGVAVLGGDEVSVPGDTFAIVATSEDQHTVDHILDGLAKVVAAYDGDFVVVTPYQGLGETTRKVVEYWARRNGKTVELFVPDLKLLGGTNMPTNATTVVVKQPGVAYADLLRSVKRTVGEDLAEHIMSVRKGRNESLEVKLTEGEKVAPNLRDRLKTAVPDIVVHDRGSRTRSSLVHVKDLDQTVTKEEVMTAVTKLLEAGETAAVISLRAAYGSTQNAAVALSARAAHRLAVSGRILVGWQSCRVELRGPEQTCYRCWGAGHTSTVCKGPDRSKRCYNCGEEGHKKMECSSPAMCLDCGKGGHRTGARTCTHKW